MRLVLTNTSVFFIWVKRTQSSRLQLEVAVDPMQGPVGSWAQDLSVSPISLIIRKSLHSAPMTFPGFMGDLMGRFKLLLIREGRGCETREKQSRAALGQGSVPPSKDTHNSISELLCRY